ncbi:hypothetical protein F4810DRAFT_36210 [Camillea tinctor]|nr:hypothetical protein F4810DRAFT_36210 [Camillea tinctor]
MLLRWNKPRVARYCELANNHRQEPWNVQPLQKQEWEVERAETYMEGRSGLFVVGSSEDLQDDKPTYLGKEGTAPPTVKIDPKHPLANPQRAIPPGVSRDVLSSTSEDEFLNRMEKEHPGVLIPRFLEIKEYARQTYQWRIPANPPRVLEEGIEALPSDMSNWANSLVREEKSLCVVGATRTGKTVWAQSLGPHIFCNSDYDLRALRSAFEAKYAVFKDIDIRTFPWLKFVTGKPFIRIWDKYEPAEYVRWGIPSIFIFNQDPRLELEQRLRDLWDSHVTTVHISGALVG